MSTMDRINMYFQIAPNDVPCEVGFAENLNVFYINFLKKNAVSFYDRDCHLLHSDAIWGRAEDRCGSLFVNDGKCWRRVVYCDGNISLGNIVDINSI